MNRYRFRLGSRSIGSIQAIINAPSINTPSPPRAARRGSARIAALHCYPLKSAAGLSLEQARLTPTGLAHDRHWIIVTPAGRFRTQREWPQLALIRTELSRQSLLLHAPSAPHAPPRATLAVPLVPTRPLQPRPVTIWKDQLVARDEGDRAADWLGALLGEECRLVRFDPAARRLSAPSWTGPIEAQNCFTDGFPILVIGLDSLAELNSRLPRALPMTRFRPNIVLEGLAPYQEDDIEELFDEQLCLRLVKPCTRCVITTTDQQTGERCDQEPLHTLRTFRFDPQLQGVTFGQNAVIVRGVPGELRCGQSLQIRWKPAHHPTTPTAFAALP